VRRGAIVTLVVIGAIVGVLTTAVAILIDWLPDQASEQREGIDFVFWLTTGICIGIFALVAAVTVYVIWKFRARPDDDSDGQPIHGHTGLEIAWTAVPAVLVIVIGLASAIVLARNERVDDDVLTIGVKGTQFAWSFTYPNGVQTTTLRLPVGRDVKLELTANDVIHSFWVREFGQKMDAVPGQLTTLVITPKKRGSFDVICTELCGLGHALMRATAVAMAPSRYDAWIRAEGRKVDAAAGEAGPS